MPYAKISSEWIEIKCQYLNYKPLRRKFCEYFSDFGTEKGPLNKIQKDLIEKRYTWLCWNWELVIIKRHPKGSEIKSYELGEEIFNEYSKQNII